MKVYFDILKYEEPKVYFAYWDVPNGIFITLQYGITDVDGAIGIQRKHLMDVLTSSYPSIEFDHTITDDKENSVHFHFNDESDNAAFLLWGNGGVEIST